MRYEQNFIDEIINTVSIVDEISSRITITKKGQNFVGLCPFHDDHHPSFTVSEEKKIYKCFSCQVAGNVLKLQEAFPLHLVQKE